MLDVPSLYIVFVANVQESDVLLCVSVCMMVGAYNVTRNSVICFGPIPREKRITLGGEVRTGGDRSTVPRSSSDIIIPALLGLHRLPTALRSVAYHRSA